MIRSYSPLLALNTVAIFKNIFNVGGYRSSVRGWAYASGFGTRARFWSAYSRHNIRHATLRSLHASQARGAALELASLCRDIRRDVGVQHPLALSKVRHLGIKNEFDVEIATVSAKSAGLPPAAMAIGSCNVVRARILFRGAQQLHACGDRAPGY